MTTKTIEHAVPFKTGMIEWLEHASANAAIIGVESVLQDSGGCLISALEWSLE